MAHDRSVSYGLVTNERLRGSHARLVKQRLAEVDTMADFKYGVNTDVNIGVSVSRGGNTLFEVMGIC